MDVCWDILAHALAEGMLKENFSDLNLKGMKLLELKCCQTIARIKEILEDETLDDCACFRKIEEIICCMEDIGIDCGSRHDFG